MNLKNLKYLFLLMMAVVALASCSEDEETSTEYANWQTRNEKAFADTLAYARQQIAAGNTDEWKVILNYSFSGQTATQDVSGSSAVLKYDDTKYIVVHVLDKGKGAETPLYTDSIQMSYRGRLIPTDSYANGYAFDQTFNGTFDKSTALPTKTTVNTGYIDGFTTALLSMHPGDHWQVFIPYGLGYGSTAQTSIPAYSTLRFEMALHSLKHLSASKWVAE